MSESKNIVIKVKYPSPGKTSAKSGSGVITEWNFKCIGLALGGVLLALMALFYFTDSDDQQTNASNTQLELPEQTPESKSQAADKPISVSKPAQSDLDIKKLVVRAQLSNNVEKNEPVDNLKLPLKIGKKESLWIYYFLELKGMKGKTVYHEWLLNGDLISRKKVNISADPWRTASKQVISYTTNNDWVVRLVDKSGNKLNEKSFNLDLK